MSISSQQVGDQRIHGLVETIQANVSIDNIDPSLLTALCKRIELKSVSRDLRSALLLLHQNEATGHQYLSFELQAIKGSLFTTVWHPLARSDDEYRLLWLPSCAVQHGSSSPTQAPIEFIEIWRVAGINALVGVVLQSAVDWKSWQQIKNWLSDNLFNGLGLVTFSKALSTIMIALPLFVRHGVIGVMPMPLTIM
jgi:hypothetical protein